MTPVILPKESPNFLSLAIVVPVYNIIQSRGEAIFLNTLKSIETSLDYFQKHYPQADQISCEVVIVDDASTDQTLNCISQFVKHKNNYWVIRHPRNIGQSVARNTGVKATSAQIIFFCDADDLYLPEHLHIGFTLINRPLPELLEHSGKLLPGYLGAVKTGVKTQEQIHPYWQGAIENSIPLNLCIRRDVHDWMEGFPEEDIFRSYPAEDCLYNEWLRRFFYVAKVNMKTVEYVRYPNNAFDRQINKFQTPPGEYVGETSPQDQQDVAAISKISQQRLAYLQHKVKTHPLSQS